MSKAFDTIANDYGATIIVSTHSRHLVASAPEDAKIVWMKDGLIESDDCRDLATVMMDLGALDQLDSKGASCIVCTEDRGKGTIDAAIEELGLADRVKTISYNGINNAGSAVAIKAMCDLFPETPVVVIHRDRDFMTDEEVEKWALEYTNRGMTIFCPVYCDIEAYHCTSGHIERVYEIEKDASIGVFDEAVQNGVEKFRKKFVEKRREANRKYWQDGGGPATDDLWPEGGPVLFPNLYGKDLLKLANATFPEHFGGRRNPLGTVSEEFKDELQVCLAQVLEN